MDTFKPQLSDAVPPPAIKADSVVYAGGTFPTHSKFKVPGQVMTGGVGSLMMIVCIH